MRMLRTQTNFSNYRKLNSSVLGYPPLQLQNFRSHHGFYTSKRLYRNLAKTYVSQHLEFCHRAKNVGFHLFLLQSSPWRYRNLQYNFLYFLTFNGYRHFFQKIIPKMLFLGCHIYAKIF